MMLNNPLQVKDDDFEGNENGNEYGADETVEDRETLIKSAEILESTIPAEQSNISRLISINLAGLIDLLKVQSSNILETTYGGEIYPTGMIKIRIIEFLQAILKLNDPYILDKMEELNVPALLLVFIYIYIYIFRVY